MYRALMPAHFAVIVGIEEFDNARFDFVVHVGNLQRVLLGHPGQAVHYVA